MLLWELKPDNETYTSRGSVKFTLGYPKEAIKDFDRAIELNPKSANAYHNRGAAKLALGRREEAEKDFDKAKRLKSEENK